MHDQSDADGADAQGAKHGPQRVADSGLRLWGHIQAEHLGLRLGVRIAEGHGHEAKQGQHPGGEYQDGVGDVVADSTLPPKGDGAGLSGA